MKRLKFYLLSLLCLSVTAGWANNERYGPVNVTIKEGADHLSIKKTMEENASLLLSSFNEAVIKNNKPKIPSGIVTNSAKTKIEELWKTSKMACTQSSIEENCLETAYKDLQIRNIPMEMISASLETKKEQIALNFDSQGRIDDILITLVNYTDMLKESYLVEDIVRQMKILDFVEKFRTAYNCKDIDYLENVFSNNALIISAKEIRQKPNSDQALRGMGAKEYIFQVQTKAQYLKNLKEKVFKKNKYLNIMFDSIDVVEHPGYEGIYGVSLFQRWNSTYYKDEGYLYLLIDCRKEYEMQIFVRAWHPEKQFNFSSFNEYRFYDM